MTWSYGGDPTNDKVDEIRFLIGDTNQTDQHVSDEEIRYLLNTYGNALLAAAYAALAIAAKFSRLASKSLGKMSIQLNQKAQAYHQLSQELYKRYQQQLTGSTTTVTMPSISQVRDAVGYPAALLHTDRKPVVWYDDDAN